MARRGHQAVDAASALPDGDPGGVFTLGTFAAFAAVSADRAWVGETNCGCLGAVRVSPVVTLAIDLAVLGMLACNRPRNSLLRSEARQCCAVVVRVGFPACVILAGAWAFAFLTFGSLAGALAWARGDAVTLEVRSPWSLAGEPGSVQTAEFVLRNWTQSPVSVYGGTSDCACQVDGELPLVVRPGGEASVRVSIRLPPGPGRFRKRVFLLTDHPEARRLDGFVAGRVAHD